MISISGFVRGHIKSIFRYLEYWATLKCRVGLFRSPNNILNSFHSYIVERFRLSPVTLVKAACVWMSVICTCKFKVYDVTMRQFDQRVVQSVSTLGMSTSICTHEMISYCTKSCFINCYSIQPGWHMKWNKALLCLCVVWRISLFLCQQKKHQYLDKSHSSFIKRI